VYLNTERCVPLWTQERFQFNVVECNPSVVASTPDVINNCASYTVSFWIIFWRTTYTGILAYLVMVYFKFFPTHLYIPIPALYCKRSYVIRERHAVLLSRLRFIYPTLMVRWQRWWLRRKSVQFYDQTTTNSVSHHGIGIRRWRILPCRILHTCMQPRYLHGFNLLFKQFGLCRYRTAT